MLPPYQDDASEPAAPRELVVQAIYLAEKRAAMGGRADFDDAIQVDEQFFDNYDVVALR
jgi:hypothetical protein